jgi:hypothetical protein
MSGNVISSNSRSKDFSEFLGVLWEVVGERRLQKIRATYSAWV